MINLRILRLSNNNLSGTIPASFGNLTKLFILDLNHNQLIGPVPVELKNLTNAWRIDIDNNLIGQINLNKSSLTNKSAQAINNRQIPDELSELLEMDTLRLGGNSLQFNDIEAIFSWDNFNEFKDFIYSPQDLIGTTKTVAANTEKSISLVIDNYFPGPSDKYQWYKNGSLIANATNASLSLSNLKLTDAGDYHCIVTNHVATELIITSRKTTLTVTNQVQDNISLSEYYALKAFYLDLGGSKWNSKTNWFDTINVSINDWYGITIEDNHVVEINLPDNNLIGEIPEDITNLSQLRVLNLSNNNISGIMENWIGDLQNLEILNFSNNQFTGPINNELGNITSLKTLKLSNNLFSGELPWELGGLDNLQVLYIDSNKYTSILIESAFGWSNYDNFKTDFVYAPQAVIGTEENILVDLGHELVIEIKDYFPGAGDVFHWFKDSNLLSYEIESSISITAATKADSGMYYCQITNTIATDLTLYSKPIHLNVSGSVASAGVPLSEYLTLAEIYNSANGDRWINNENWLDTANHYVNDWYGITIENGHVTKFEMPGNNLSKIPEGLKELSELNAVDLSEGNFSGIIPSFGSLTKLKTLLLTHNNFTFKNLTPLTLWENYNNFKTNFAYNPQPEVGEADTLEYIVGDTIYLDIKNYLADENDNFKWFRNNLLMQDSEMELFSKMAWFDDNEADFYCEITNTLLPDLTLTSKNIHIKVNYNSADSIYLSHIKQEYPQLQEIWEGDSILNWPLVTFENGRITALDLSDLNLEGNISSLLTGFDSLVWLDLSNNNFSGPINLIFENNTNQNSLISEETDLEYLNIANNRFTFSDLEPAADILNSIDSFIYAPQPGVGLPFDTTIFKYQSLTFEIENYSPGDFDVFNWSKDGTELANANHINLEIENAALQDSGFYSCAITNVLFPKLTLESAIKGLKVLVPVGISEFNDEQFSIYPNPASQRVFIETKNKTANLKIFNSSGVLVFEKQNIQSGWIDIKSYPHGIYMFRLTGKDSETINKKMIIK